MAADSGKAMPGSFRLGSVAGIEIRIHFSWLLIFLLVTFSLASDVLPTSWSEPKQITVAAIAALLVFASVLAHELAHSLVARRFAMDVSSVTLFLFGGIANLTQEPTRAVAELLMAVAGPLTSFAIAAAAYGVERLAVATVDATTMSTLAPVTTYLTTVNVAVGIFNLVPGFPLDGGRVLRALIWAIRGDRAAATRIAARGGQVFAVVLGLVGVVLLVIGGPAGLWYMVIGYFLYGMASSSLAQERLTTATAGVRVSEAMTRLTDLPLVSPDDPLVSAIERFADRPLIVVVQDGVVVGVLHPDAVGRYVRSREAGRTAPRRLPHAM